MKVLNFIAGLCSIVGLGIAFWQIMKVKRQIEKTYNALYDLHSIIIENKTEILLSQIKNIQQSLAEIIGNICKQGVSLKMIKDEIQKNISTLDKCDNELPEKYEEVSQYISESVKKLREALSDIGEKEIETIKDPLLYAETCLKSCIHILKKESESALDNTINIIAKAN